MGATPKIYSISIGHKNDHFLHQVKPKILAKPAFRVIDQQFCLSWQFWDTIPL
jgi:hypothetical protein